MSALQLRDTQLQFDSFRRPDHSCFSAYLVLALLTLVGLHFIFFSYFVFFPP